MILHAEGVEKHYLRERRAAKTNQFTAVEPTDLQLEPGTLTVLTGRSGSGKSTLLHMLAGLLRPDSGRVLLGDTDLYALPDSALARLRGEQIGMIPQGVSALYALTVRENILLPASVGKTAPDTEYADRLMEALDIAELCDEKPAALSGGELRRTAIARALIRHPSVILADEPTGDLDGENTAAVFSLLRQTAAAGAAVLVVTHEPDAGQYADRVLHMQKGRLSADAPPTE